MGLSEKIDAAKRMGRDFPVQHTFITLGLFLPGRGQS